MCFSGHKFNGLKDRALLIDNKDKLEPIVGGGQEYGVRSGTVNLPMNVSLVKATLAIDNLNERHQRLSDYNHELREFLKSLEVYISILL